MNRDATNLRNVVNIFKAFSDETRLRILHILSSGAFNVNEIVEILGMGQSRVSRHLKILLDSGIVDSHREGTWIYYKLSGVYNPNSISGQVSNLLVGFKDEIKDFSLDKEKIESQISNRVNQNKKYFNTIGKNWENIQEEVLNPMIYREKILSYIPNKSSTILDLGCGPGVLLSDLSKHSNHVIGIDMSKSMLQAAKDRNKSNKKISFIESNLEKIPLKEGSAETIIASMVLHHLSNPHLLIKEVDRLLTKNGTFCLVELAKHNQEFMREKYSDLWLGFDLDVIREWLINFGFEIQTYEQIKTHSNFTILTIKAIKKGGLNVRKQRLQS
jgi:ubiquinone/menaquinone biosynthesis C-methylase UbiE/DNA-binding transcriptional ArsR family regulator